MRGEIIDAITHIHVVITTMPNPAGAQYVHLRLERIARFYFPERQDGYGSVELKNGPRGRLAAYFSDGTHSHLSRVLTQIASRLDTAPTTVTAALDDWFFNYGLPEIQGLPPSDNPERIEAAESARTAYSHAVAGDQMTAAVQESRRELTSIIESARSDADELRAALKAAQQAAGAVSESELATAFKAYANRSDWTAALLSGGSVVALLGALWFGYEMVHGAEAMPTSLVLGKAALTLPILAIAAYLGRLAGHERDASRWSRSAQVQLQTLDAFTKGLEDPTARDAVKSILARRIFSTPDFGGSGSPSDVVDTIELVKTITDTVQKVKPGG